ncbi:methionine sulfoxide reductase A [Metschnikowia bicuspidata var. bicuspidata NRRL YB-4993]|uniref:peptide-methionine (S)-S-oxide reductase n=1 Tax=Metschnikowia bicuspidata var. bicuspidata NRRL YB-4993 TaxID=869754 RepID=A0A1A0H5G7_9ASCO|nr:methionine sulfoxide reductase A [Metschnikowia bicuspidata var. bicuspidata NRRL YB-4993]OBA19281.1 methionine sulfoxide reductase A [Metschnikowia bicuspidata var. bicuspidata NRRL YB-4993]
MSNITLVSPTLKSTPTAKIVTLAAGCFWGVERVMGKYFKDKGLIDAKVGYANGLPSISDVSYKKVCSGATGFAESLQLSYDPSQLSLKEILDIFFRIHDPTTFNAQGPDQGTQYRSAIFVHDQDDLSVAQEIKAHFQKEWYPNHKIATEIDLIKNWYDAEDYHQKYLDQNPGGYECPTHFLRTKPKA